MESEFPYQFPYPGLRPFRPDETLVFFGREKQVDELLEKLEDSRFIAVLGPSGCGKSSLVNTGLIASLQMGLLASKGSRWQIVHMRPQGQPFRILSRALAKSEFVRNFQRSIDPSSEDANLSLRIQTILERGSLGLCEILDRYRFPQNSNLLVVVDQFEEIFRYQRLEDKDKANAFIALLLQSAAKNKYPIHVVITMRSDFLGNCTIFPGLPEAINKGLYFIPRLTREQINKAIIGPANVCDGRVDKSLVNHLLNSIDPGDDQLPVLQHALMQMWTVAEKKASVADHDEKKEPLIELQRDVYEEVGGLRNALSNHADETYNKLSQKGKRIAQYLFCALTERIDGGRDIRRPVRVSEVATVAGVSSEAVIEVADQFRHPDQCFLVPSIEDLEKLDAESLLDISHESLIRLWDKLRSWVEQEAKSAEIYHRLETTALRWKNERADLLGDIQLKEMVDWKDDQKPSDVWASRYGSHYTLAMEYLEESKKAQKKKQKIERLKKIYLVPIFLSIIAVFGWYESFNKAEKLGKEKSKAEEQEKIAKLRGQAYELIDQSQKAMSFAQLAFNSNRIDEGLLFTQVANDAYKQFSDLNRNYALSDQKRIFENENVFAYRGLLDAFSVEPRIKRIFNQQFNGRINAVAFSPEGDYFAVADQSDHSDRPSVNGKVYILSSQEEKILTVLTEHTDNVSNITFLADGSLVSGGWDSRILWWTPRNGQYETNTPYKTLFEDETTDKKVIKALVTTGVHKGQESLFAMVNTGTESKLMKWQFSDSKLINRTPEITSLSEIMGNDANENELFTTMAVTDTREGRYLILGTTAGRLMLWKIEEENNKLIILDDINDINSEIVAVAAYANEGEMLLAFSAKRDNNIFVCVFPMEPEGQGSEKIKKGCMGINDENQQQVNLPRLEGHEDTVLDIKFNSNGSQLVSGGRNGELFLWRMEEVKSKKSISPFTRLRGHSDWVRNVAFSPDNELLVSGAGNGSVVLWSLGDKQFLSEMLRGHSDEVWNLTYLSDHYLVSGGRDTQLRLWHFDEDRNLIKKERENEKESDNDELKIIDFAYNSRHDFLLSAVRGGRVSALKISDDQLVAYGQPERSLEVLDPELDKLDKLDGIALSQDANLLATSTKKGKLILWRWHQSQWKEIDLPEPLQEALEAGKLKVTGWGSSMTFLTNETGGAQLVLGVEEEGQDQRKKYYLKLLNITLSGEDYDVQVSEKLLTDNGHRGEIVTLAWGGPNGQYLASGGDDNVLITWKRNAEGTWQLDRRFEGHTNRINTIKFNPEKYKNIVASGSRDRTIRLWDIYSGKTVGILRRHTATVDQIAFSPDGTRLASASDDKTIIQWNVDFDNYPAIACSIVGNQKIPNDEWNNYLQSAIGEAAAGKQNICEYLNITD